MVTNVGSQGTQLIRYKVGDLGRLSRGSCACGLNDTQHLRIEGRFADAWKTDAGWITEARIDEALADVRGLAMHQLTRLAPNDYRLTVIADGEFDSAEASAVLESLLGANPVVIERDRIEVSSRQKYSTLRNWCQ
ncbi:MAG: hypothetical protein H7Z43_04870 [Clostridia bacterium]|nr:hypothetical protein [Deltaproteobacteria bacterium]